MAEASINPAVLEWAIAESGLSTHEVAEGLKLKVELLEAWVGGDAKPDVTALRRLSKVLNVRRPPSFSHALRHVLAPRRSCGVALGTVGP